MSATLTWFSSGLGTKTGTTAILWLTDLKTLIDSKSGDSNFKWEVQASNLGSSPYYLWIRRKDASNGRILVVHYGSAPAGNNAAIFDTAPGTTNVHFAWFPNGSAASPSNLTASSGTISGDDTNCVKAASTAVATPYGTGLQPYYFDCNEGIVFCTGSPTAATGYWFGAGDLVVDGADNAYGCTFASAQTHASFGTASGTGWADWISTATLSGAAGSYLKTNYGSTNRCFFSAYKPSGAWATQTVGPNDILTDTANLKSWFVPFYLVATQVKGGGFPIKLRQIALGPVTVGAFSVYQTTGPVVQARAMCSGSTGSSGSPWMTNFKL